MRWLKTRRRERAARKAGAFWMPCPLCGEPFGGNEVLELAKADLGVSLFIESESYPGFGQMICTDCAVAGEGDPKFLVDNLTEEG